VAGLVWEGYREIRSGLEAGEVVVARAGAFFRDGDKVQPVTTAEESVAEASQ
jgi:HlyD family secretion protein